MSEDDDVLAVADRLWRGEVTTSEIHPFRPETSLAEAPDVGGVATGAAPRVPAVDGLEAARASGFAITLDEAMARDGARPVGDSVIIWGAGEGGELAIDLKRGGKTVRLLDAAPGYVPANYLGSRGMCVGAFLAMAGLTIEGGLTLTALGDGEATFTGADGTVQTLKADTVIIRQGRQPLDALAHALRGKVVTVQTLGDARKPRSYGNAIHEAAYLARQI